MGGTQRVDDNTAGQAWQGDTRVSGTLGIGIPVTSQFWELIILIVLLSGKNVTMNWIYLSPHLDDVALSCGGLVWEQVQAGDRVSIWTICAGNPPPGTLSAFAESIHVRWQTGAQAVAQRRAEDLRSCQILGATPRHFALADCLYRRDAAAGTPFYASEEALFGEIHPGDAGLVHSLGQQMADLLNGGENLISPLAIGGHVDHRLVRAAESLQHPLWYYADYPYVARRALTALPGSGCGRLLSRFQSEDWRPGSSGAPRITDQHLLAGRSGMKAAIHGYTQQMGGTGLYLYK
jgi:hypothetical protein